MTRSLRFRGPMIRCPRCGVKILVESRADVYLRNGGAFLCPPCQDKADVAAGRYDDGETAEA